MGINKIFFCGVLIVSAASLTGCSTMQDVVHVKETGEEGTTRNYPVNENQAWEIAKTVFRWEGSDAIEEHKEKGYMLTSSGMNLVSYGTVMGAWIEKLDANNSKVTVVTKRRISINIATTLTEGTFHKRFEEAVGIIKSGQQLPANAPNDSKSLQTTTTITPSQHEQPPTNTTSTSLEAIPIPIDTPAQLNKVTSQNKSAAERLRDLKALYDGGYISKIDFETKKQEILKAM